MDHSSCSYSYNGYGASIESSDRDEFIARLNTLDDKDKADIVMAFFEHNHIDSYDDNLDFLARDVVVLGGGLFTQWTFDLLYDMEEYALADVGDVVTRGPISVRCVEKEVVEE